MPVLRHMATADRMTAAGAAAVIAALFAAGAVTEWMAAALVLLTAIYAAASAGGSVSHPGQGDVSPEFTNRGLTVSVRHLFHSEEESACL